MKLQTIKGFLITAPAMAAVMLLVMQPKHHRQQMGQMYFRSFAEDLASENLQQARLDIDSAIRVEPDNAYYAASSGLVTSGVITITISNYEDLKKAFNSLDTEQIRDSVNSYRQAIALNPGDDAFYHNLAWLYYLSGNREAAYENLRRAIEIGTDMALYHVSLGLLLETDNRVDEAFEEYFRALSLHPAIVESKLFIELQRRWPMNADAVVMRTIKVLEARFRNTNDMIVKAQLGTLYWYKGRTIEAEKNLREVLVDLPGLSRPWLILADYSNQRSSDANVELSYRRAAYLGFGDYVAWSHYGDYFLKKDNKHDAIKAYAEAISSWMGQQSVHAERVARLYRVDIIVPDDVLPRGLLFYTTPYVNVSRICETLARLYREIGDEGDAQYYDRLGRKHESF